MKNFNKHQLAVIALIVIGTIIRLIKINQPLLEFFPQRQTQTAEITRNIYVNGWTDFWTPKVRYLTPRQDSGQTGKSIPYVLEFPLYNGLVAALYRLFGPSLIWGRIASITFFVLSAIIFYRLIQLTINNQQLTIFTLIFFVFSPLHILTSRSFQPEELALFLLLLAVYKKSWIIFSIAVLTKLPIALFAPVMLYTSLRGVPTQFLLSLLPAAIWYSRASRLTTHPAITRNFDISNWFQPQLWLQPRWYFSLFQIEHVWVLTTLGLLFFWLGLFKIIASFRGVPIKSGRRGNPVFWLVWLTCGIAYLAIFNYHAMTHEYYHLFLLPPLSVIAGLGLGSIHSDVSKHWSKLIFSAGIIILTTVSLSLPAIRKIISAPKSPEESPEITADRYRLIESF